MLAAVALSWGLRGLCEVVAYIGWGSGYFLRFKRISKMLYAGEQGFGALQFQIPQSL
jgi:hypothetical protein